MALVEHEYLDSQQGQHISPKLSEKYYPFFYQWCRFEEHTALLYLALLAQYLANEDSQTTVTGTDIQDYESLILQALPQRPHIECLAFNMKGILPIPRDDVPLSKIVRFKRKRRTELLYFRELLDNFQKEIRTCERKSEIRDVVTAHREKIQKGAIELNGLINDSMAATVIGSVRTIIKVESPTLWATIGTVAGKATKLADIPIEWSLAGISGLGAIEIATYLIDKRNERRAILRTSPFAYLYHAGHEGIT